MNGENMKIICLEENYLDSELGRACMPVALGFFGHTIEEYLIPFETTARLCNLELLAPVYTCGISYADRDADKIAQQKTLAREHASRLVELLNSVVNNPEGE